MIQPIEDHFTYEPIDPPKTSETGLITLPDGLQGPPKGKVINVGLGPRSDRGDRIPHPLRNYEGKVVILRMKGTEVTKGVWIAPASHVMAVEL